jgi:isoquinoline 1-oxidoreductase beta subunit
MKAPAPRGIIPGISSLPRISRRGFMGTSATAGAGLVLGLLLPGCNTGKGTEGEEPPEFFQPNAWVQIDPDDNVTLWLSKSEMGQGVMTALPMILAEELEVDWQAVKIQQADADQDRYGSQTTGGSTSTRSMYEPLRRAGATGREMLLAAAAATWQVDQKTCRAEKGTIIHLPSRRRRTYGQLATKAALMVAPSEPAFKEREEFTLVGKPTLRVDTLAKIKGEAQFGIDMRVPGMLYAVVARPPVFGGHAESHDATRALEVPGVRKVVRLGSGIAVLAQNTWAAMEGRKLLKITWNDSLHFDLSSSRIAAQWEADEEKGAVVAKKRGDPEGALASAKRRLDATFELPYLAHAPMEPMNCLAYVRDGSCEIWAPTQAPRKIVDAAVEITGLPREAVKVHVTFMGGGFGRRLEGDYGEEAIRLSRNEGLPVKVIWTREDDMRHGVFRPGSRHRLSAGLDGRGRLSVWTHRVTAPSIGAQKGWLKSKLDEGAVSGAANLPYSVPSLLVDYAMSNTRVPIGFWRSVYDSQTAFANECFIDELAELAGRDPYEFRRLLLIEKPRYLGVLDMAAQKAGWRKPLPPGRGRGIAVHYSFHSYAAQVVEVSVSSTGHVTVHKVVCAIDCGRTINPLTIEAQIQGSIVFGLTAALKGEITFASGKVEQGNFDSYRLLRMSEMPEVEAHIVPSDQPPTGVGEPVVPTVAPALANAIYAATGVRVRKLPIKRADLLPDEAAEV